MRRPAPAHTGVPLLNLPQPAGQQDAACSLRPSDLAQVQWSAVHEACLPTASDFCTSCICGIGNNLVTGLYGECYVNKERMDWLGCTHDRALDRLNALSSVAHMCLPSCSRGRGAERELRRPRRPSEHMHGDYWHAARPGCWLHRRDSAGALQRVTDQGAEGARADATGCKSNASPPVRGTPSHLCGAGAGAVPRQPDCQRLRGRAGSTAGHTRHCCQQRDRRRQRFERGQRGGLQWRPWACPGGGRLGGRAVDGGGPRSMRRGLRGVVMPAGCGESPHGSPCARTFRKPQCPCRCRRLPGRAVPEPAQGCARACQPYNSWQRQEHVKL